MGMTMPDQATPAPVYDVLMAGNYFCDIIFTGIPGFPALGTELYCDGLTVVPGGVLNTVVAMRRLGLNVGWIGVLGNDFFSRYTSDWIAAEGIDSALLERRAEPFRRATVSLSYPSDRAFVTYVDPAPDMIGKLIAESAGLAFRSVHFAGLMIDPRLPPFLRELRARGVFVSMDCQHRPYTLTDPLVAETLQALDLFMPNALEAAKLTGGADVAESAARLLEHVPRVVIKQGAAGASAWWEGQHHHWPALPVTPVDTTGAGDVFNSGFLAARLAGEDVLTCLRWGNAAGGLSTLGYGGSGAAPRRDQVIAALRGELP
jgi:sugar/nucleoside kinase (ribokinase family)